MEVDGVGGGMDIVGGGDKEASGSGTDVSKAGEEYGVGGGVLPMQPLLPGIQKPSCSCPSVNILTLGSPSFCKINKINGLIL